MFLFYSLLHPLSQYATRAQMRRVAEAFMLAADAHETQARSSGEPYITHPVAVATILADLQLDPDTIMAALLHDVLEDTPMPAEELQARFGAKVVQLVDGVSKLTKIHFASKAQAQAENFRKMMLAMVEDLRVILIKLADRVHNMRTLGALRPDKQRRIAQETMEIYVPLAHRLGVNVFKTELEDLCFKAMFPLRYRILAEWVVTARGSRRKLVEKIQAALAARLAEEGVPAANIVGREKRLYSIYQKMLRRHVPLSEIMDVYGFRVLARDERECYRLLGAVHSLYKPVPGRFKDYIAIPKANSYQSLHTTLFGPHGVPVEIQIRTPEMNYIAEKGIAAHWLYKSAGDVAERDVRTQEWLAQVLEMQKRSGDSLDFIEDVKVDLFPDEVYVFTPKGDIMALPRGVTALDFAYAVHTDLGNHCEAVKVNRRLVPLNEVLHNGESVEVVTSPLASPDPAWLNIVVTGRAKAAIRQALKAGQLEEAGGKRADEGLLNSSEPETKTVVIGGAAGPKVQMATCCYPIPGDEIQGVVEGQSPIEVHRKGCSRLAEAAQDGGVLLSWAAETQGSFAAQLSIDTGNEPGLLAAIAQSIADDGANIDTITGSGYGRNMGRVNVVLETAGRNHLARVIRHLRRVPKVIRVARDISPPP